VPGIIFGPPFDTLPTDPVEKHTILRKVEEILKLYYQMMENILTAEEEEERRRQAAIEGPPEAPM